MSIDKPEDDGFDIELECPECDDGFVDHPGCSECGNVYHMGHAVTCSRFTYLTIS